LPDFRVTDATLFHRLGFARIGVVVMHPPRGVPGVVLMLIDFIEQLLQLLVTGRFLGLPRLVFKQAVIRDRPGANVFSANVPMGIPVTLIEIRTIPALLSTADVTAFGSVGQRTRLSDAQCVATSWTFVTRSVSVVVPSHLRSFTVSSSSWS